MNYADMNHLVLCREFSQNPLMLAAASMGADETKGKADGAATLLHYAELLGLSGNVWQQYVVYLFCTGDNLAARTVEKTGTFGPGLTAAMKHDMAIIWPYVNLTSSQVFGEEYAFLDDYTPAEPKDDEVVKALTAAFASCTDSTSAAQALLAHYASFGRGKLAAYMAFRLSSRGDLIGIDAFPHNDWNDLIGYEVQKEKLLTNTLHFVEEKDANNVLLTGARGTGKSTAVKALVYRFHTQGLRLIQISRDQLQLLPQLMETLCAIRSKKFILFFDDLSFDEDEKEYKYLKSAIDGGVSPQPKNVVMYATSNRRHLLKETWKDRNDGMDEVYRGDSTNESISLSDRFGLIIHYGTPTQDEYLAIIDHELQKHGISIPKDKLRVLGVRWEMEHSGRNGRIAQQFVKWYVGNKL